MSPALPENTMQIANEMDDCSALMEQNLPCFKEGADSRQPAEQGETAAGPGTNRIATAPFGAAEAAVLLGNRAVDRDSSAQPDAGPARTALPDIIGRTIENTVVGLQHTSASSLTVVLKPDNNTELSLHFRLQRGHFEALAVLERGDLKALNSGWALLQGRLADQGIRLAPLVSMPRASTSGGEQFSSSKQRQDNTPATDLPQTKTAPSSARKSSASLGRSPTEREWWA
jgi:hypothetical protein